MYANNKTSLGTIKLFSLSLLFIFFVCSCYHDSADALYPKSAEPGSTSCDTSNVSYSKNVNGIFLQNCALPGCHASSAPTGGYTLDNYNGVKAIVLSGRIIGAITHTMGYASMPKDRTMLNNCQIGLIKSWINQGAQNN